MKKLFPFFLLFLVSAFFSADGWGMAKRPPVEKEKTLEAGLSPAAPLPLPVYTLEDCFKLARQRSETLAISEEAVQETLARFLQATGEALGDVDLEMTHTRREDGGGGEGSSVGGTLSAESRRERRFVIKQPIFQGFKSLGALAGAGSLRKQRKAERVRTEELLFEDVANAFYTVLEKKKEAEIVEEMRRLLLERLEDLEARERIGRSRLSEVVTARARLKSLEAERARVNGAFSLSRHLLEFLTGLPLEAGQLKESEISNVHSLELEKILEAVSERSDVKAAEQAMKVAKQNVVVTQSALWPTVSLEHDQYEKREGFQSGIDWDLYLTVDVPIFRGGGNFGKFKEALSEWKKAKLAYQRTQREAELDIKEAHQNWATSLKEERALRQAVRASLKNYRLQKEDYEHNLVNNLEVLEALEALHETKREANRARYEMKQNYYSLQAALGIIL